MRDKETLEEVKDLAYYKSNAEEDYLAVPISVLRYISQLEQQERSYSEKDMKDAFNKGFYTAYGCKSEWIERIEIFFKEWLEQYKKK